MKKEYSKVLLFFLDLINSISDKKYQEKAWIKGEGSECDSFDELVCVFLEEYMEIKKNYKRHNISESQYLLLNSFCREFESFSNENDWPYLFIDTHEWNKITKLAKDVLKAFNYKK